MAKTALSTSPCPEKKMMGRREPLLFSSVWSSSPDIPSIIHAKNHEEAVLQMYNPTEDSNRLKNQPELFETLRGDYPLRREEKAYIIKY